MATTVPVHPSPKHWMGRHKVWTALLVFAVLAVACGAIL